MKIHWARRDENDQPVPTFELDRAEREAVLYALGTALDYASESGEQSIHHKTTQSVYKTLDAIHAAIVAMNAVRTTL